MTPSESRAAMHVFALKHLPELCLELEEWHECAILRDGRMRELAELCTFDAADKLRHAERLTERLAIQQVGKPAEQGQCVGEIVAGAEIYDGERWVPTLAALLNGGGKVGDKLYAAPQPAVPEGVLLDAERYRWLRDNQSCQISITHNDHHVMYMDVSETLEDTQGYYDSVSDEEKAEMVRSDSIWTIHDYKYTPVGFSVYHAATLDGAIDAAMLAARPEAKG